MCAKKPVDGAHELNLEPSREQTLKTPLNLWVLREVDEVVNVDPQVQRFVSRRLDIFENLGDT